ncbi:acyl-CoA dehydrogenase [Halobacteriales archaeon QS_3_64_16]|nr:MAG: acyl-CoA dehydrogenase [Halobacteriales archaeon QS_3_64_16]
MFAAEDDRLEVVGAAGALAEEEFADRACSWQGKFPWENLAMLADHGLVGVNLPEEYGGRGMDEFTAMAVIEAVGRVCPDTANALYVSSMVSPRAVDMFGSEAAKEKYLPPICAGDRSFSIAISEPAAGSDAGSMRTQVEEDAGDLTISGEKIWVGYLQQSAAAMVWTRFPDGNLGTVIVDLNAPGIEVLERYENMAGQIQTHFRMDDVPVPAGNVLVRGERAFKRQLRALNWERLGSATYANAISRCALENALEYAREREQFDQPISEFQGLRWKLADATADLEASRAVAYRAARRAAERDRVPDRVETNVAKLYSGQVAEEVVSEALQVFGARGYQRGHPLEYLYRLQRSRRIAAGTDEIVRNTIADQVIEEGLPDLF